MVGFLYRLSGIPSMHCGCGGCFDFSDVVGVEGSVRTGVLSCDPMFLS